MEKKLLVTQSNYIPWKGYFDMIKQADVFVIYDDMQYTRRDWRNRNLIKTANGTDWLTIPVDVKGKYFQKINETAISDKDWNTKHWKTISQCYAKAPFYNEFKPVFEELYLNCSSIYLSQINYRFIQAINKLLHIKTVCKWSSEFELIGDKSEKILNICKAEGATTYISGPSASGYLDESSFNNSNIRVHWADYSNYPEYPQLHGPFTHQVSIIDLIFNTGSEAFKFLKN